MKTIGRTAGRAAVAAVIGVSAALSVATPAAASENSYYWEMQDYYSRVEQNCLDYGQRHYRQAGATEYRCDSVPKYPGVVYRLYYRFRAG